MNSNTIGRSETITMPMVTSEKFCLMTGTLPKSKPAPRHKPTHASGADQVEEPEGGSRHRRRAGDERHEGPDDRDEAAEDDGLAAVLLEEGVRALEVLAVQQPVGDRRTVGRGEDARADRCGRPCS